MSWLQLKTRCQREQVDSIEDALLAAGAVSVTFEDNADQPILEPAVGETPLWNDTLITGLFTAETDTNTATLLATAHLGESLPAYKWEILEDKDWERCWMDNYKPMQFGRLWICPSWEQAVDPAAINLRLDPGLAFGTGTHPTTALCLRWLSDIDLHNKTVIDFGCGSGILGIAAVLLGAKQFIGIDNDPQALIASKKNAEENQLNASQYQLYLPEECPDEFNGDVLIANILAEPLIQLVGLFAKHVNKDAPFAISGILSTQVETVSQHYEDFFVIEKTVTENEWALVSGQRA